MADEFLIFSAKTDELKPAAVTMKAETTSSKVNGLFIKSVSMCTLYGQFFYCPSECWPMTLIFCEVTVMHLASLLRPKVDLMISI